jgi:hypothetical protein
MGNVLSNRADSGLENETLTISCYIALDGSSNVIGYAPTASPPGLVGPYTRAYGVQKAIGPAGAIITQPHTSTGLYTFTLDEPWYAAHEAWVQQTDQGAVASLTPYIDLNVTANQLGGAFPGCNPAIAPQTILIHFRAAASGAPTNPAVNTAFWFGVKLRRGQAK